MLIPAFKTKEPKVSCMVGYHAGFHSTPSGGPGWETEVIAGFWTRCLGGSHEESGVVAQFPPEA